ncbi:MAG: hypothetical protein ACRDFB_02520 [Rhabdochlamydiaceae bacterium]
MSQEYREKIKEMLKKTKAQASVITEAIEQIKQISTVIIVFLAFFSHFIASSKQQRRLCQTNQ